MTPFRQLIRPGQDGTDVLAVKRAMRKMGARGAKDMKLDRHAGNTFVKVLDHILAVHNLKADHIYGPGAHEIIAPHFDKFGVSLYVGATIRKPPVPPLTNMDARHLAIELMALRKKGSYIPQNPGDWTDITRTANGDAVWSQGGYWVHMWAQPLRSVVSLIEEHGFTVATYALCSDHHNDGPHGHSGGRAVDIVALDGVQIASQSSAAHQNTLRAATLLRGGDKAIDVPRQLICDGYGNMHSGDISACCVPYASLYGWETLSEHRNHIHYGA